MEEGFSLLLVLFLFYLFVFFFFKLASLSCFQMSAYVTRKSSHFTALSHISTKKFSFCLLSLLITAPTLASRVFRITRVYFARCLSLPEIRHTGTIQSKQVWSYKYPFAKTSAYTLDVKEFVISLQFMLTIMHGPALNTTLTTQTSKSFATAIFLRKPKRACQMFEDLHKNLVYNDEIPFITKCVTFFSEKVGATSVLREVPNWQENLTQRWKNCLQSKSSVFLLT